jgi:hypothetical protein
VCAEQRRLWRDTGADSRGLARWEVPLVVSPEILAAATGALGHEIAGAGAVFRTYRFSCALLCFLDVSAIDDILRMSPIDDILACRRSLTSRKRTCVSERRAT